MLFPNESMIGPNGVPMNGFGCNITFFVFLFTFKYIRLMAKLLS